MRTVAVILAVALLLVGSAFAQDGEETKAPAIQQGGGVAIAPGLAYRFTIPDNVNAEIQTSAIGQLAAHYLVPLTLDGEWNLQVIGGVGVSNDLSDTMLGLGAAYAPRQVPNVIVGLAMIFDVTFPTDEFMTKTLTEDSNEAWLAFGLEGSLDFKVGGLPGSVVAGWAAAIRGKPDMAYFAFNIPMSAEEPESRVRRSR